MVTLTGDENIALKKLLVEICDGAYNNFEDRMKDFILDATNHAFDDGLCAGYADGYNDGYEEGVNSCKPTKRVRC